MNLDWIKPTNNVEKVLLISAIFIAVVGIPITIWLWINNVSKEEAQSWLYIAIVIVFVWIIFFSVHLVISLKRLYREMKEEQVR